MKKEWRKIDRGAVRRKETDIGRNEYGNNR